MSSLFKKKGFATRASHPYSSSTVSHSEGGRAPRKRSCCSCPLSLACWCFQAESRGDAPCVREQPGWWCHKSCLLIKFSDTATNEMTTSRLYLIPGYRFLSVSSLKSRAFKTELKFQGQPDTPAGNIYYGHGEYIFRVTYDSKHVRY